MGLERNTLSGKVAIVTGGGSGIGRGAALEMAKVGADVVLAGRRPANVEAVAQEIRALGRKALAVPTDVRYPEQIDSLIAQTLDEFGRIDILVNSHAGQFPVAAEDLSRNGWRTVVDIDFTGTWFTTQAAGKVMIQQGYGRILNIIATYAWKGYSEWVHAAASKAGVWNMSMTLAVEWGPHGITINCLAPGAVFTEGIEKARQLTKEEFEGICTPRIPLKRITTVEEVGQVTAFLVSDMASYITGSTITMDGGTGLFTDSPPERTRRRMTGQRS